MVATMQLEQPDASGKEVGPDALARFRRLLTTGSYMAVSHITSEGREGHDARADAILGGIQYMYRVAGVGSFIWRTRAEIEDLLGDYEPVESGWLPAEAWGKEHPSATAPYVARPQPNHPLIWAAVGQKLR